VDQRELIKAEEAKKSTKRKSRVVGLTVENLLEPVSFSGIALNKRIMGV